MLYAFHFAGWIVCNGLKSERVNPKKPIHFCWRRPVETQTVNCLEACVNGCILGDDCPHREHLAAASKFIQNTSMDEMLAIAEDSIRKKFTQSAEHGSEGPVWIDPPQI
jgi:hypothetical protein